MDNLSNLSTKLIAIIIKALQLCSWYFSPVPTITVHVIVCDEKTASTQVPFVFCLLLYYTYWKEKIFMIFLY